MGHMKNLLITIYGGGCEAVEAAKQIASATRENAITEAAYTGDIVSRLRNWRGLHLAHGGDLFEEAADEIESLRRAETGEK